MQNYPMVSPELYYVRLYREQGKLRLEVLREAMNNPRYVTMKFYSGFDYQANIHIYFDNLDIDFAITEALSQKIYDYFSKTFHTPGKPKYL